MRMIARVVIAASLAVVVGSTGAQAAMTKLTVIMFPGLSGLGFYVAQDKGIFAKHGLDAEVTYTPTSDFQRKSLAEGKFDIAQSAADNAVYMVDSGAGDAVIVAGGSNSMNELMARPDVHGFADIRGKAVVVDAPNTAFAFLLYKMLALNGLKKGDYTVAPKGGTPQRLAAMKADPNNVAGIVSPPFNFKAEKDGFHSLGSTVKLIGAYQGDSVIVMRSWAKTHGDALERYLAALIEANRWAFDPANRKALSAILAKRVKLDSAEIEASVEAAVGPQGGFARDIRFDPDGFKTVLALRAEFAGPPGAKPPAADKYIDLSYYQRALAAVR